VWRSRRRFGKASGQMERWLFPSVRFSKRRFALKPLIPSPPVFSVPSFCVVSGLRPSFFPLGTFISRIILSFSYGGPLSGPRCDLWLFAFSAIISYFHNPPLAENDLPTPLFFMQLNFVSPFPFCFVTHFSDVLLSSENAFDLSTLSLYHPTSLPPGKNFSSSRIRCPLRSLVPLYFR